MVNKITLIGHCGDNPDVHYFNETDCDAKVSLATDDNYKDKDGVKVERTDWHRVVFRGGLAKVVEKWVKKGDLIYVSGKSKTRSYEDTKGVVRYVTEVICSDMKMLGGKKEDSQPSNDFPGAEDLPM